MIKLIPILCIITITVLFLFYSDLKESSGYTNFRGYQKEEIVLDQSSGLTQDLLEAVLQLADQNHILIAKKTVSNDYKDSFNIYFSFSNIDELEKFLKKNFMIHFNQNPEKNQQSFFSTYLKENNHQVGYIKDLFQNQYYNYYLMSSLLENGYSLYGSYTIYYQKEIDYQNFIQKIEEMFGTQIHTYAVDIGLEKSVAILSMISLIVILSFYFLFETYQVYSQSSKIGCLRLLGFSNFKISHVLIQKTMKKYGIFMVLFLIFLSVIIKNMSTFLFIKLLILNLLLLVIVYFIHYICVCRITRSEKTSHLLKKKNIAKEILKVSKKWKVVITVLLLLFIPSLFQSFQRFPELWERYQSSKLLLQYGVFSEYLGYSEHDKDYESHVNLYQKIVKDKRLDTFYVDMGTIYCESEEDPDWLKNSQYIPYGTVDRNYLMNEKIKVYNESGDIVDVNQIKGVFFLFPKSKISMIDVFLDYYWKDSQKYYEKYQIPFYDQVYFYEDQKLNTYEVECKNQYVNHYILRVIDESLTLSYHETSAGIQVFGLGMSTALKIKMNQNKNVTFDILNEHIKELGLQDLLSKNNFVTYQEYFGLEFANFYLELLLFIVAILIIIGTYIMITIEIIHLYLNSEQQKIFVKQLLGYSKEDIFQNILKSNFLYNIVALELALILSILLGKFYIGIYLLSVSIFLGIDFIVLWLVIHFTNVSRLFEFLKGK